MRGPTLKPCKQLGGTGREVERAKQTWRSRLLCGVLDEISCASIMGVCFQLMHSSAAGMREASGQQIFGYAGMNQTCLETTPSRGSVAFPCHFPQLSG